MATEVETAMTTRQMLNAALVVLGLGSAFMLVPRLTHNLELSRLDKDAPLFTAPVVANAEGFGSNGGARPTLDLASFHGRPVVLDFWATWCGPCQMEAPIVNALAERYKDRGLAVVGVNTSDADGLAEHFARRKSLHFPIVFDADNAIAQKYDVSSLPTLVVVSKEGKIVAVRHGLTSAAELDELIRGYL
jgi:thiol-disulfide isomerase/thioredoxin